MTDAAISDPVRHHARTRPDAPALVTPEAVWTWADLDARVDACAARIATPPGRHADVWGGAAPLAVRARTSPDLVVLVLAALRAGRTLVPLSTRWPAPAVADALDRLGLDALAVDDSDGVPSGVETTPLDALMRAGRGGAGRAGAFPHPPSLHPSIPPHRPLTVVHTSGSTGTPKAALHTVGNHVASARGVTGRMRLGPGDRWLLDLPLYHVGGLGVVVRCAISGAALALPAPGMTTPEAASALRPTHASLVSTQLRRLLGGAAEDVRSLKAVLLGGSAIPSALLDEAAARAVPVATSYGLTEMTSTVTATAPGADRPALDTSGTVLDGCALRVTDGGEIEAGGAALFAGYVTSSGLRAPGAWFPTGDLGRLDGDGRLVVSGRRGLMFVSGGENVQPEAIEAELLALDAVAEAVVVPVPDAEFGPRPAAFVRTHGAAPPDPDALRAALRRTLPGFMVPTAIYAWGGAGGLKPDRPALARLAAGRDRGIGKG